MLASAGSALLSCCSCKSWRLHLTQTRRHATVQTLHRDHLVHLTGCVTTMAHLCPPAVIPPFHTAVDQAISYLHPVEGLLGVADFYVSGKYDLPMRQHSYLRRVFWK